MDWLLTNVDYSAVAAWCLLDSGIVKPVLGIIGVTGLFATIGSLWWLPDPTSDIITVRNRRLRYRCRTKLVGLLTLLALMGSIGTYTVSLFALGPLSKVCAGDMAPPGAAKTLAPFFGISFIALILFAWLQARVFNLKNPDSSSKLK
jgi:hypothetical protein